MTSEENHTSTVHDDSQMDVDDQFRVHQMSLNVDDDASPSNQGTNEDRDETSVADAGRGISLAELRSSVAYWGPPPFPRVQPSPNHTVLYKLPWRPMQTPVAYPNTPYDRWDQEHVRMPNSSESLYPVQETEGEKDLRLRWELVQEALCNSILSSHQLEAAVLSYNSRYNERWNFRALHTLFNEVLEKEECDIFFKDVLPIMVMLALQLPELITAPIPLLRKHKNHSLSLSQIQIGSLLANAFFCTFPRRNSTKRGSEYSMYPDINFNRLFQSGDLNESSSVQEKLKCILNYFRRICVEVPFGVVTFSRRYIPPGSFPDWSKSTKLLPQMHITSKGCIEDEGAGMLQVDFANKFIGGGVLGWGCVQEEIRFVICPELIVSRLFTECLDATEAVIIVGCERFNQYSGYGHTFEWVDNFKDECPLDSAGRRHCSIVAMDALCFRNSLSQYTVPNLIREVNKAYVGFCELDEHEGCSLSPVATGNWGCGAFGGDAHLKALLQLMAAGEAGRALVYFTFGDENLRDHIYAMYKFLVDNNVTIGKLWALLNRYSEKICNSSGSAPELYEFLYTAALDVPEDANLKPKSFLKRIEPMAELKPSSSRPSPSRRRSKPECSVAETGLTSEDVDALIEEFDSDVEGARESPKAKPTKKKETPQVSSKSCLTLIEESLEKDKVGTKADTPLKMPVQLKAATSTSTKTDILMDSPTENSAHVLMVNETKSVISGNQSENSNPVPIGESSTTSDLSSSEVTRDNLQRSAAPKRKISDYFNPL